MADAGARAGIEVELAPLEAILALRDDYRREMDCQIVHDSFHARGFTDSYLLRLDGQVIGYGSVAGEPGGPREVIKEFYVLPAHRGRAAEALRQLIAVSGARWIEAQTNDSLLSPLLFGVAIDLGSEIILFNDALTTWHAPPRHAQDGMPNTAPDAVFRALTVADRERVFTHTLEPVGEWGIVSGEEVFATGGFLTHYNPPWADIFMEVAPAWRQQGCGRFLVQELKRLCYERGLKPAARCRHDNEASRRTLQSAGMLPCARIVRGRIEGKI